MQYEVAPGADEIMKPAIKKGYERRDDTLYGLLSLYKPHTSYFRVLVCADEDIISLWMTANPGNWLKVTDERYKRFRELRRLEIGVSRLSIKYLHPDQLIRVKGPLLGIRLPSDKTAIVDTYRKTGVYIIETSMMHKRKLLTGLASLINMAPSKKFEIIEKCVSDTHRQV